VPRAGLTPETVTLTAARIADESGFDTLTLAAVAQDAGVALPSLYKHVEGLDGLRVRIAVLAVRELGDALGRAAVGTSGRAALRALATAYLAYAREHPGRYAATLRAPDVNDEEHIAASDAVLHVVHAVLRGYRLSGNALIDATRSVRSALHGFAALEAAGGFGMPRDVDRSFAWMVDALDRALSTPASPARRRR
jgi:AcrR family transcriptional regulator